MMTWWLTKSPWNDERVAQLRELWAAGLSAAQVAVALGAGFSRNAVLGKIHRLGLGRPKLVRPHRRPADETSRAGAPASPKTAKRSNLRNADRCIRTANVRRQRLPQETAIAGAPLHLTLADLAPPHCRWPYGDGPYTFCGRKCAKGSSYCAEHDAIALRKAARKRRFVLIDLRARRARTSTSRKSRRAA